MNQNGGSNFRHQRSSSSDRFLDLFSSKNTSATVAGDDFDEDDVFWTGDFAEPSRKTVPKKLGFESSEKAGILAALPDSEQNRTIGDHQVHRKSSISSSRAELPDSEQNRTLRDLQVHRKPYISSYDTLSPKIRSAIPKPLQNTEKTTMFSQSAPINVPMMSKARSRNGDFAEDDESEEEEEMLPPHEIVAREKKTTFSVLEGIGRTLKGRDLRQVRNAVWRQTGFLD